MTGEQSLWLLCAPIGAKVHGIVRARGGGGDHLGSTVVIPATGMGCGLGWKLEVVSGIQILDIC